MLEEYIFSQLVKFLEAPVSQCIPQIPSNAVRWHLSVDFDNAKMSTLGHMCLDSHREFFFKHGLPFYLPPLLQLHCLMVASYRNNSNLN